MGTCQKPKAETVDATYNLESSLMKTIDEVEEKIKSAVDFIRKIQLERYLSKLMDELVEK